MLGCCAVARLARCCFKGMQDGGWRRKECDAQRAVQLSNRAWVNEAVLLSRAQLSVAEGKKLMSESVRGRCLFENVNADCAAISALRAAYWGRSEIFGSFAVNHCLAKIDWLSCQLETGLVGKAARREAHVQARTSDFKQKHHLSK